MSANFCYICVILCLCKFYYLDFYSDQWLVSL